MHWRKQDVIETLLLIADADRQKKYQEETGLDNMGRELLVQWFDESYFPEHSWFTELFSEAEWKQLQEFSHFFEEKEPLLPDTYAELIDNFHWKEVMGRAQYVLNMLGWGD